MFRRTRAGGESASDEMATDDETAADDGGTDEIGRGSTAGDDPSLRPRDMRGSEIMYGYLIASELIVVSILDLTVTHGKGAPTGPQHLLGASVTSRDLAFLGLAASIGVLAVIQTRNRFVVPFAAIIAAFFATLPKVPDSLSVVHLVGLVVPIVFAFVLTQRQRKDTLALANSGRSPRSRTAASNGRAAPARGRRSRRQAAVPTGPQKNRRYTPPKAKRPRR